MFYNISISQANLLSGRYNTEMRF